ncbi:MAG: dipicolinate synthase subunit [Clostridia bacterium]|nr:dipicolinate synthase subunit [Clostridia bacterium]
MGGLLAGVKIAVLGGDARELVLIPELVQLGAEVRVVGYPPRPELSGCTVGQSPQELVREAEVIILPVPGVDAAGLIRAPYADGQLIFDEELAAAISAGALVLVGTARPWLKEQARKNGWRLIETADLDEMAILNSIPTAEGAIMLAMQELPFTIHGSNSFVLGLGRVGFTLACMLAGLGGRVTVVDRGAADRARAYCQGWRAVDFAELPGVIGEAEIIFNTVPAMVLTAELLTLTRPDCFIIDLALAPGGTDFEAARNLGRRALLAPGLPGKVAPKTAGQILARIYPRLICEHLGRS